MQAERHTDVCLHYIDTFGQQYFATFPWAK